MTGNVSIGIMAPMPARTGDGQHRAKAGGEQADARNGFDDALQTRNPRAKPDADEPQREEQSAPPAEEAEDEPFWKIALAASKEPADAGKTVGEAAAADEAEASAEDVEDQPETAPPAADKPGPETEVDPEAIAATTPVAAANGADASQRRTGEGRPVGAREAAVAPAMARSDASPSPTQAVPQHRANEARPERIQVAPPPAGDTAAMTEGQRRGDIAISSAERPSPLTRMSFTPLQVATLDARTLPAPALQPAALATFAISGLPNQQSVQAIPVALGITGDGLVSAIEGNASWRSAAAELVQQPGSRAPGAPGMATSMRIQLHPAELGMVTARLVTAGSQMSIEIQVETNDARQRLSAETDAIIKALRAVGLDVDRITIQQSSQSGQQPSAGQQGLAQGGGQDREGMFAQQQSQGENGGRRDGGAGGNGREGSDDAQAKSVQDHAGSGVYI